MINTKNYSSLAANSGFNLKVLNHYFNKSETNKRDSIHTIAILGSQVCIIVATALGVHRVVRIPHIPTSWTIRKQALLAAHHHGHNDFLHRGPTVDAVVVVGIGIGYKCSRQVGDSTWIERIDGGTMCPRFEIGGCRRIAMCPALEIR